MFRILLNLEASINQKARVYLQKKIVVLRIIPLVLFLLFVSCDLGGSDSDVLPLEPEDFTAQNDEDIQAYLTANELVATKTATGLYYHIENQGDGIMPTPSSTVTVAYKGYFLDGTVFDESDANGLNLSLEQVILGWQEGIPLFNEGGSGILYIPAHLGYGSFNFNGIPGGSVLVFDIELLSVEN